jgi:hypothetical protein
MVPGRTQTSALISTGIIALPRWDFLSYPPRYAAIACTGAIKRLYRVLLVDTDFQSSLARVAAEGLDARPELTPSRPS